MDLSKVCDSEQTITSLLATASLLTWCSAFGETITLLSGRIKIKQRGTHFVSSRGST